MTRANTKAAAAAIREYQMARGWESVGDNPLAGVELPDGFTVDPDADRFWADDLMFDTKAWLSEPSEYGEEVCRLGYKVSSLRSAATGGAIRYDRERVMGGQPYTIESRVLDIIETEQEFDHARCWYKILLTDVRHLLERALDDESARVWYLCCVMKYSREMAACQMGITKRRVQWLLEKKANRVAVLLAFCQWRDGVEYYED